MLEPLRKQEDKCERQCVAQISDFAAKIIESEIQFKYFAATVQEASDQRQYKIDIYFAPIIQYSSIVQYKIYKIVEYQILRIL